ncbi:MAG TPA: transposase [Actinoallomurus sp.]|jgi:IS605 OrfB family transposase|nr:transposase [Actinoallomurus sp.]
MRFRLQPTPAQEEALLEHCAHARFVWNLAVEQHQHWRPGRASAPGYGEQARQLTEARRAFAWLSAGSQTRFRWSRAIHDEVKSFRVTRDRAGRWHAAFAVIPPPVSGPGTGEVVGVDRGVVVSAALSTGELLSVPGLRDGEAKRAERLQRSLARAKWGSNRRQRVKAAIARLKARETDRRKDWVEKTSSDLAHRFDVIRVEDLKIKNMVCSARGTMEAPGRNVWAKAGLNRSIHAAGWGQLVARLQDKAPGRVEKIDPAYTSQTCSACGHCAAQSRESRAAFRCRACGHADYADVNAARNIAVGRTVTARGGRPLGRPVNREPQLVPSSA